MSNGLVALIVIGVHVGGIAAFLIACVKLGDSLEKDKVREIERGVQRALDKREARR
jgi:hypothetical protein